jgi:hypothetical protein
MAVRCTSATAGSAVLKQASAPWHRLALMLPIAANVGRITTRNPGSIWATMVSGVLAHKSKKEQLKLLFFMLDTFQGSTSGRSRLRRDFFWPPQLAGLERAEMNRRRAGNVCA